ncbi:MAG: tRNA (N6-isopentenyl adenosine(37)-C2)-methylthiotransferase MiaB [Bacteroidetes bacterium GWA2_32_17]|nr:MAG: tRNA (N6-isopentenyl adenosine(37)-C2)-methylthiotransferase MiaB [Bacteroidetes bacterium GWA2_32_17]
MRKFYIETYGCQMNVADSEVIASILTNSDYIITNKIEEADVILVNTCSIRDNAEQRVHGRLKLFSNIKKKSPHVIVGVLGCMAERLKEELLENEKVVDLVVGPDSYRDLPTIIKTVESGQKAVNVYLSQDETYDDISPIRYDTNGVSAFVSIMRGCQNMCAYCIVPYVRGAERSRSTETIINEIKELETKNYKEITLIGQNVDSYLYVKENNKVTFANLLKQVAIAFPGIRIRFSTNHPKDLTDNVLQIMAKYNNVCKNIHLPVQSGSTNTLQNMKRGYTREWYLQRIEAIRNIVPECAISTDIMVGFCGETDSDHQETLSLIEKVGYDFAFMFKYSERKGTFAARKMKDDVPEEIKVKRLNEVIELQNKLSTISKLKDIGKIFEVLVEGVSKKSKNEMFGRNSQNKVVVFPSTVNIPGDLVKVEITKCTSATLIGKLI